MAPGAPCRRVVRHRPLPSARRPLGPPGCRRAAASAHAARPGAVPSDAQQLLTLTTRSLLSSVSAAWAITPGRSRAHWAVGPPVLLPRVAQTQLLCLGLRLPQRTSDCGRGTGPTSRLRPWTSTGPRSTRREDRLSPWDGPGGRVPTRATARAGSLLGRRVVPRGPCLTPRGRRVGSGPAARQEVRTSGRGRPRLRSALSRSSGALGLPGRVHVRFGGLCLFL